LMMVRRLGGRGLVPHRRPMDAHARSKPCSINSIVLLVAPLGSIIYTSSVSQSPTFPPLLLVPYSLRTCPPSPAHGDGGAVSFVVLYGRRVLFRFFRVRSSASLLKFRGLLRLVSRVRFRPFRRPWAILIRHKPRPKTPRPPTALLELDDHGPRWMGSSVVFSSPPSTFSFPGVDPACHPRPWPRVPQLDRGYPWTGPSRPS